MKNIVLIGAGKWGKNYITTLASFEGINLSVATRDTWKQLIDGKPDGVIIATPPSSHIEIASYALERNIATMIEKPLCLSSQELSSIQATAPVLVNHIHLFATAFHSLKVATQDIKIEKIFSLGYNNGPHREYSSLWDYGSHDIAMVLYLAKQNPHKINTELVKTVRGDLFNVTMYFDKFESESLVGNGGAHPIRKFKIHGEGLKYIYDDKIRPAHHAPPLTNALNVFIKAIDGVEDDRLGLDLAIKVTKILELCQNNLNKSISINIAT